MNSSSVKSATDIYHVIKYLFCQNISLHEIHTLLISSLISLKLSNGKILVTLSIKYSKFLVDNCYIFSIIPLLYMQPKYDTYYVMNQVININGSAICQCNVIVARETIHFNLQFSLLPTFKVYRFE